MISAKAIEDSNEYELSEDLWFHRKGVRYIIPKGFRWDGASIPRAAWSIIGSPFEPDFMQASCIHDWCFVTKCLSFKEANDIFKTYLNKSKVGFVRRYLIFAAVASFGWFWYRGEDKAALIYIHMIVSDHKDKEHIEYQINSDFYKRISDAP